jgi:hypothetical protein
MAPPSETRSFEEIRADLERTRAATRESLEVVRRELQAATDWRAWVRRRPGTFLAIATALGFGLGLVGRHSSAQDSGGPHGNSK